MSANTEVGQAGVGASRRSRWGQDRFFVAMSLVAALVVFAGFARTYFLKGLFGAKPLTLFFHLHGVVFSAWIVLFVVQSALVRSGRTDIHRRLGVFGALLVPLMVVIGGMAAIDSARRGFTPPNGPPPLVFFVIPLTDLLVFSTLVGTGIWFRGKPEYHKRLMLLATISILTPAIARLPVVSAGGPAAFLGLTDLLIVICMLFDKVSKGRVHRAFLWGGLFIIASQPLRFLVAQSDAWLSFARWVIR